MNSVRIFLLALIVAYVNGAFYVDPNAGVDSLNCTNIDTPCKSVRGVVNQIPAKSTTIEIVLYPGTYTGDDNVQQTISGINFVNITGVVDSNGQRPLFDCQRNKFTPFSFTSTFNTYFNNIEIANCQGTGTVSGGALNVNRINNRFVINNCVFRGNSASNGGAIYSASSNIYITNSVFSNNTATSNGGAVNLQGGSVFSTTTYYLGNAAGDSGGAVYATDINSLSMSHSIFRDNTARQQAGAIYEQTTAAGVSTYMLFTNTSIDNNCITSPYTDSSSAQLQCLANCTVAQAANFTGCANVARILPAEVAPKKLLSTTNKVIIGVIVPFVIIAAIAIGAYIYYNRTTNKEMKKRDNYRLALVRALDNMTPQEKEAADREAINDVDPKQICQLCRNRPINTILPCGHRVVCTFCRTIVVECPMKGCKKATKGQGV